MARAAVGCAWRSPEWHGLRDLLLVHTGVTRSERNLADCLSELIRENAFSGRFQASDDCESSKCQKRCHSAYLCPLWRFLRTIRWRFSVLRVAGRWARVLDTIEEVQGLYGAPTYG